MELVSTSQVDAKTLSATDFDLFIGASGYEERAAHALGFVNTDQIPVKVAFGFQDRMVGQRERNDSIFRGAGVDILAASGDSAIDIQEQVKRLLEQTPHEKLRIFVDYSSMTRAWYAAIIRAIRSALTKHEIACYFGYSPAQFAEPTETVANAEAGPISGFCGLEAPDKPSALIIGLGYERDRALGLMEYIDPATCFAFLTDPALDANYRDVALQNNSAFLATLQADQVYAHPLADLQRTSDLLLSVYGALRDDYRVILAPLGVKPFSLLCLLLATRFGDVDVWRVTPGTKLPPQVRKPSGTLLVLRTVFLASAAEHGKRAVWR